MNSLSRVALFTLISNAVFAVQATDPHAGMAMHEQPAIAQAQSTGGKGIIKAIDTDSKRIIIAREVILAVGWPPMTMRFTITPQTQLDNMKNGDSVGLTFVQQGSLSLLQDIHTHQQPGDGKPLND